MATIQLKRSNTAGANPTTSNLALGELGINTKDGKFFLRKYVDGNASGDTILTYAPQGINAFGTQTYEVKVVTKTAAHPQNGTGSSSGYSIDGLESPFLLLVPGNTYKFDQADSSNSGHPLRFYLEEDKTTAYTTGVTTNGTPGTSGAYTQIVVATTTPQVLYYQCSAHAYMGSASYSVSDAIADGKVGTAQLAANAVTSAKIAANSVDSSELVTGSIDTIHIGDSQVTGTKIADNTIATGNIADNAVDATKIASNSILTRHIDDNQIGIDQLNVTDGTSGQALTTDGAGTLSFSTVASSLSGASDTDITTPSSGQILVHDGTDSFDNVSISGDATLASDGTLTIATNAIESTMIAQNSILTKHIDDNQIGIDQLNVTDGTNGQVLTTDGAGSLSFSTVSGGGSQNVFTTIAIAGQSDVVADSTTDTLTLAAGTGITLTTNASTDTITITGTTGLSANSVTATEIATGAVGASELAATTVTAGSYTNTDLTVDADGRITSASSGTATIADGAITTAKLADDAVTAAKLADTAVTAGTYGSTTVSPQITVDAQGRITGVSNQTIAGGSGGSGGIGLNQTVSVYEGSGDGSTTAFDTGTTINAESLTWVFIDGVYQEKGAYSTSGSTVTFSAAPPNGTSIEVNNLSNVTTGGAFNHNSYNGDGSTTAFTLSKAPGSDTDLIVFIDGVYQNADAFNVSGTTLTFDTAPANSTKVIAYTIGGVVMGKTMVVDTFNGDASTTAFTLSMDPTKEENTQVYVGGVYQPKGTYSLSGTTLTFSEAPPSATGNIEVNISQVTTLTEVGANSVSSAAIAANAVGSAEIAANSVDSSELVTGSIDTIHIGDDQVTNAKLAVNSVSAVELAGNSVTSTQIAANQVTSSEIATDSVGTIHIVDDAVTSAKLDTNIAVAGTLTVSTVGAMGTHSQDGQNNFFIGFDQGSSDVGLGFGHSGGTGRAYFPCRVNGSGVSNVISLGTTTYKYKDLHLAGIASIGNLKIGTDQGTDGQLLTSTGSGVAWEDAPAGGPTFKTFGTSSIMIGDTTTGTIDAANNNVGLGVDVFAALTSGDDNVAVGKSTLDANTTGSYNTALGNFALSANTTANFNTALGRLAMLVNTTGASNVAIGAGALQSNTTASNNTAVGADALVANTTGTQNIAVGATAGDALTEGGYNVAVGYTALGTDTKGSKSVALGNYALAFQNFTSATDGLNTAVGHLAGYQVTTGTLNTLIGGLAGDSITTGANNTALGHDSLGSNTTGDSNTALGEDSLQANTTASNNVAVGRRAMFANTTGTDNVAMGHNALDANTTASNNTAIGHDALTANTTGYINTAVGNNALSSNAVGLACTAVGDNALAACTNSYNTAVGRNALAANTSAASNSAFGANCLATNTTGASNSAFGFEALYANTTGASNVAAGNGALDANVSGNRNVAIGQDALGAQTFGSATDVYNTAVGFGAGSGLTSGQRNTIIGGAANLGATTNDSISIGYNVSRSGNGYVSMGSGSTTVYIPLTGSTTSWSATSDERLKTNVDNFNVGLDFINNLNPIAFNWKKKGEVDSTLTSVYEENSEDFVRGWDNSTHVGFLAQDIKEQVDAFNLPNGVKLWQEDSDGIQGVADGELIPMFVNAIKELSAKNDALEARLTALEG